MISNKNLASFWDLFLESSCEAGKLFNSIKDFFPKGVILLTEINKLIGAQ